VTGLVFAAMVGFSLVAMADRANPWGVTTGILAFLAMTTAGVDYLMGSPHPVVASIARVGFALCGLAAAAWAQARPEDLVGGRLPSVLAVRIAGIGMAVSVVVATIWTLRARRRARARAADSSPDTQRGPLPSPHQRDDAIGDQSGGPEQLAQPDDVLGEPDFHAVRVEERTQERGQSPYL